MHNGVCVAENTFFQARELRGMDNGLQCFLANSDNVVTTAQGKWLYPIGNPVNCSMEVNNLNSIGCSTTNKSDGVILYTFRQLGSLLGMYNGLYTCCLPDNCSDDSSSKIIVRIYGKFNV